MPNHHGKHGLFFVFENSACRGRFFNATDKQDAPGTVVVSRAFVKAYLSGENPVGKRIRFTFSAQNAFLQIVGVAGDTASIDMPRLRRPLFTRPTIRGLPLF